MFSKTTLVVSAFAAAIAASFWSSGSAVSGESWLQEEGDALYRPIQSISYEFGSKAMSGYFVQRNSVCLVTLMIAEKTNPDLPSPTVRSRGLIARRDVPSALPVAQTRRRLSSAMARETSSWRNKTLR